MPKTPDLVYLIPSSLSIIAWCTYVVLNLTAGVQLPPAPGSPPRCSVRPGLGLKPTYCVYYYGNYSPIYLLTCLGR